MKVKVFPVITVDGKKPLTFIGTSFPVPLFRSRTGQAAAHLRFQVAGAALVFRNIQGRPGGDVLGDEVLL
jgi:hypothetical protein